jgi:hypothetical protein
MTEMPPTASPQRRPPLVTAVAVVVILAGIVPLFEITALLVSPRFSEFFLPLVDAIVPLGTAALLALLLAVGVIDVALGIGILMRYRVAMIGMFLRSFVGVVLDYINLQAHNPVGALFGFVVNVGIAVVLLLPKSRTWFWPAAK